MTHTFYTDDGDKCRITSTPNWVSARTCQWGQREIDAMAEIRDGDVSDVNYLGLLPAYKQACSLR